MCSCCPKNANHIAFEDVDFLAWNRSTREEPAFDKPASLATVDAGDPHDVADREEFQCAVRIHSMFLGA